MTLFNCLLWTTYGLPVVEAGRVLVSTINGTGAFLAALYIIPFLALSTRAAKVRTAMRTGVVLLLFATIVLVTFLAFHTPSARSSFLGICSVVVTVGMYASPLEVMLTVVRTRSVEFMPLLLSLSCFVNGLAWSAYGAYTMDIYILIPNGIGTLLGFTQLVLYGIYSRSDKSGAAVGADGSREQQKRRGGAGVWRRGGSDSTRHMLGSSNSLSLSKDAITPEEMVVEEEGDEEKGGVIRGMTGDMVGKENGEKMNGVAEEVTNGGEKERIEVRC
ncbi:hypothetical protein CLOM_g16253 [Closterium sp. NIES-68]|nr:hypothetical protein CLOM_g16253 [Closterium sp. NIES-68]GJP67455.1 hypothetical protein CLOP_g24275 [Closterium sp. NIES-67]